MAPRKGSYCFDWVFGNLTRRNPLKSKIFVFVKTALSHLKTYWLSDASFAILSIILVFTVFILPILISYQQVDAVFVNVVFLFLVFTGIWSSQQKSLILITSILFFMQLGLKVLRFSELPYAFIWMKGFLFWLILWYLFY